MKRKKQQTKISLKPPRAERTDAAFHSNDGVVHSDDNRVQSAKEIICGLLNSVNLSLEHDVTAND